MKRLGCFLAAAIGLLATSTIGEAASDPMTTLWAVQPSGPAEQTVEVVGGDLILKQRLLPTGLARLTGAVERGPDKRSFAAGTQLFEVKSDVRIYCVAGMGKATGLAKFAGGATPQFCFVDANADGAFEGYFQPASMVSGLPTIDGARPSARPMAPIAYEVIDPASFDQPFWVGIQYLGKSRISDQRNFVVTFGSDFGKDRFDNIVHTAGATYPEALELQGARFTVLGVQGNKLKLRIDQAMPAQPFAILRTVTIR